MNRLAFLPFLAAAILAAPQFDGITPPADLPGGVTPPPTNGTQPQPPADLPQPTPPSTNSTTIPPPPGASDSPMIPGIPTSAPPPSENGTESGDQGGNNPTLPIPGSPIAPAAVGGSARAVRALQYQLPVAQYVYQQPLVVAQGYQAPVLPLASGYQYQYQHVPLYYPLK